MKLHTHHTAGVRPTHSTHSTHSGLGPGRRRGERPSRRALFGLTHEAILLTSDPHQGAVLGLLGALPGTQRVPRQRLPAAVQGTTHVNGPIREKMRVGRLGPAAEATLRQCAIH